MKGDIKDITFIIRATPFNTIALSEAMRMAVGLTLHDNRVNILLTGDGAWAVPALSEAKNALKLAPHIIGRPDIYESLEHFSACGVKVFVDEASLMERGISGHEGHIEKISRRDVYDLIGSSDVVMSFR